jgi:hypothetical protein
MVRLGVLARHPFRVVDVVDAGHRVRNRKPLAVLIDRVFHQQRQEALVQAFGVGHLLLQIGELTKAVLMRETTVSA